LGIAGFSSALKAQQISADSLYEIGDEFYLAGKYDEAIRYYVLSGEGYLEESDSLEWARTRLKQIDALINKGDIQLALESGQKLAQEKPSNAPLLMQARINYMIGWAYRHLEEYEKSKEYYLKGIEFVNASGDSLWSAYLNNNISYVYLYTDNFEKALFHLTKAKELYEAVGSARQLSFVLNDMYNTLSDLGLHKQAEKYIRESLKIRKELNNPNLLDIAYHNMASSYKRLGQTDSAIINYQKSLQLSRMLENPYDITQTLFNIGDLYMESGEDETALLYFNEALEFNRQTNRPVSIAENLRVIAQIAAEREDYTTAETFYGDALSLLEEAQVPGKLAGVYFNMAKMEIRRGDFSKAEEHLENGFEVAKQSEQTSVLAHGHRLKGEIYAERGDFEQSLAEYKNYHKLNTTEGVAPLSIWPAIHLARAYNRVDSDSAFVLANQAFENIDAIRNNVSGFTFKAGFFSEYAGFYAEVASWYVEKRGDHRKAFELVEGAKARVLMDELAEAESKLFEQLDESTLIRKQQMQKQIDKLYSQIRESSDNGEIEELRNELKNVEFRYQTFLNSLRSEVPGLETLDYPEPMTATQAKALLDTETAILAYAFANDKLIRFFVTQDDIVADITDSIGGEPAKIFLTEEIRKFRSFIISESGEEEFSGLSDILIPDEEDLRRKGIKNLIIVPGGSISFVPFEALKRAQQYLIQSYNIKYLPSVSIYPFIQSPHRSTEHELLALAGSGFEGASDGVTESSSQSAYASLPSTLLEVDSIAVNFSSTRLLKNEEVTEATLKSFDLGQFRFIHFATHAQIDEINPSQSGLVLSRKMEVESLFGEDGHLNSTEIAGLRLNADLVTLSACETGMGKIITGEGLLGLQRSFLTAGSSSVMVSLWNIFDRSTSIFMARFYRSMLQHKAEDYGLWSQGLDAIGLYEHPLFDYKAKALRDAKLAMIDHPYYNKPVHWAPFILIGK
jgi:CHAT domain-containing protein/Tfp pilus assembly protein PilF